MVWNFVLAFMVGVIVTVVVIARIASGVLQVFVPDDPDQPAYLGVKLGRSNGSIHKKKYVLFKVEVKTINSQN